MLAVVVGSLLWEGSTSGSILIGLVGSVLAAGGQVLWRVVKSTR